MGGRLAIDERGRRLAAVAHFIVESRVDAILLELDILRHVRKNDVCIHGKRTWQCSHFQVRQLVCIDNVDS